MRIVKSFFTFGGITVVSRILGFARDAILAKFLGASQIADIFFVAFRVPNVFRRIFAEGALQSAFIPIFNSFHNRENKKWIFASQVNFILFFTALAVVGLMFIFMPEFLKIMAPGYRHSQEFMIPAVFLSRITVFYLFFVTVFTFYSSIFNSYNKFALFAWAPCFLNIGIILFLCLGRNLSFSFHFLQGINNIALFASLGVVAGGFFQLLLVLFFSYKSGIFKKFKFILPIIPETKKFLQNMIPVVMGMGIYQINLFIDTILASFLPFGSISYLFYADRINQLPLAITGISTSIIILPTLSRYIVNKSLDTIFKFQEEVLIILLYFSIPASIGLFVVGKEVITVLFERGKFVASSTTNTYYALMAYTVGLVFVVWNKILAAIFYARKDTKTPFIISIFILIANLCCALVLVFKIGFVGLALAASISAIFNTLLFFFYGIKYRFLSVSYRFVKESLTLFVAGLMYFYILKFLLAFLHSKISSQYLFLLIIVIIGGLIWFFLLFILGMLKKERLKNIS